MSAIKPIFFSTWCYHKINRAIDYAYRLVAAASHIAQDTITGIRENSEALPSIPQAIANSVASSDEFQRFSQAMEKAYGVETHATKPIGTTDIDRVMMSALSNAVASCPGLKKGNLDAVEQAYSAATNSAEPIKTDTYLDIADRSMGIFPAKKSIHVVNDPQLAEELLNGKYAKRGDILLDSGFKADVVPIVKDGDNMLICPFAQHMRLRSPLEKTLSKKKATSDEVLHTMSKTAIALFFQQVNCTYEIVIEQFVFSVIVRQILGMDLQPNETVELIDALKTAANPTTRTQGREQLEKVITKVLEDKHYVAGGGLSAIANAALLSEAEKISTAILMFAAGMHTTTSFLQYFLDTLTKTGYSEQIYTEWKSFLEGRPIHSQDELVQYAIEFMQQSVLLNCCFLEAMRLYPVIPVIKRVAKKNFLLGDKWINAGDEIHINVMAVQHDGKKWDEAKEFRPERFKDAVHDSSRPKLLNFGLGSQSCIGKHFFESEAKVMGALFCILLRPTAEDPLSRRLPSVGYANQFNLNVYFRDSVTPENYSLREE